MWTIINKHKFTNLKKFEEIYEKIFFEKNIHTFGSSKRYLGIISPFAAFRPLPINSSNNDCCAAKAILQLQPEYFFSIRKTLDERSIHSWFCYSIQQIIYFI